MRHNNCFINSHAVKFVWLYETMEPISALDGVKLHFPEAGMLTRPAIGPRSNVFQGYPRVDLASSFVSNDLTRDPGKAGLLICLPATSRLRTAVGASPNHRREDLEKAELSA